MNREGYTQNCHDLFSDIILIISEFERLTVKYFKINNSYNIKNNLIFFNLMKLPLKRMKKRVYLKSMAIINRSDNLVSMLMN
jgi:hypothetical protein